VRAASEIGFAGVTRVSTSSALIPAFAMKPPSI
jgi:hypothetical protein